MSDPIRSPLSSEDAVYGDQGAPIPKASSGREQAGEALVRQHQRERNELVAVLNTEAGQAVVMRLLAKCDPYGEVHMAEHAQAAMIEGRRRLGLWLIGEIRKVDPDLYPRLLIAHHDRQRRLAGLEAGIAAAAKPTR